MTGTGRGIIVVGTRICSDGRLWEAAEITAGTVVLRDALGRRASATCSPSPAPACWTPVPGSSPPWPRRAPAG